MDGLFEILIILAIFLLPALEGMIKKRKQGGAGPEEGSPRAEDGEPAGSPGSAPGRERAEAGTRAGGDRSAEELLPDDLWAILTGQERPKPPEGTPAEPSSGSLERGEPGSGEAIEAAPGGAGLGGMMSEEPAPTGEPSYGYEVGDYGVDEGEAYTYESGDIYRGEATEAREPTEAPRADAFGDSGASPEASEGAGPRALSRAGVPGTSGLRRSRASKLQQIRTGRIARRGADAAGREGGLHPSFQGLNRGELRRAIVLREVLGPPLGLRDEDVLGRPPGL